MEVDIEQEFPLEARKRAVEIVNKGVLNYVSFTGWGPDQMRANWRRRSLNQIRDSREVNFLVPCIDTAALAAAYLAEQGDEETSITIWTDKYAAEKFVQGGKKKLHVDATARFQLGNTSYFIDIGAGDISLLTCGGIANDRQTILKTTRPNEPFWHRTSLVHLTGETIIQNPDVQILELLLNSKSEIPLELNKDTFYQYNAGAEDGDKFSLDTNLDHYREHLGKIKEENSKSVRDAQDVFPGLRAFDYKQLS